MGRRKAHEKALVEAEAKGREDERRQAQAREEETRKAHEKALSKEEENRKAYEKALAREEEQRKASEKALAKEEEQRKASEKALVEAEAKAREEEEGFRLKEKRDSFLVEVGQLEVSLNEKEAMFSHYLKNQIESCDPTLLLDQIDRMITGVDSIVLQLEKPDIDNNMTFLRNKMRSYAEEVNSKRQHLLTRC